MSEKFKLFWQLLLAGLLSGGFLAAILGFLLLEQSTRIAEEVRAEVQAAMEVARTRREWREQSLSELMGPIYMNLGRTKSAFDRWSEKNLYLESKVIAKGNEAILTLLLTKSYLIPPELRNCANQLIQHYDVWLEEFKRKRLAEQPDLESTFVFAGPKGFPFPRECGTAFREKFEEMWVASYGRG